MINKLKKLWNWLTSSKFKREQEQIDTPQPATESLKAAFTKLQADSKQLRPRTNKQKLANYLGSKGYSRR